MNEQILFIITSIVTYVLGSLSKKNFYINSKLIPIQNLFIGIIVAIVDFIITKDFKTSLLVSGLFAGGTYDILHNIKKICGDYMIYPILNINITGGYTSSHKALDLGWTNTTSEELLSCCDGVVEDVYTITTGGNTILIDYQNGYKSYFMHCSKIVVKKGDRVSKRQLVAYMGMTGTQVTGPHCHFILTLNGERVNPIEHCYIEDWQKISDRTKEYNVMYKHEQPLEDNKNSKQEEPVEEKIKIVSIDDEVFKEEKNLNKKKKICDYIKSIFEFVYKVIKVILRK